MQKLFTKSQDTDGSGGTLTPDVSDITERIVGMRVLVANPANVDMLGNPDDSADENWITLENSVNDFEAPLDPLPQFRDNNSTSQTIKFIYYLKKY